MYSQVFSPLETVLENIIFIAEVFGDRPDKEIPDVPIVGVAKSFMLKKPSNANSIVGEGEE